MSGNNYISNIHIQRDVAVALLIATIRNLIENNATTIKFKEMISFEYDGIIG